MNTKFLLTFSLILSLLAAGQCSSVKNSQAGNQSAADSEFSPEGEDNDKGGKKGPNAPSEEPFVWDTTTHSLDYEKVAGAAKITPGSKSHGGKTDRTFTDGLGREVYFRGWNVSGAVKLVETGFKPFKNTADAEASLNELGKKTGSNMLRFTIAWEGIHTGPDSIDYDYLNDIIAQMRVAIARKMYILVDYHQDLFSRHLFHKDSWHTGNGAPAWVTPDIEYPTEYCGVICLTWAQNKMTNEAIRLAFRNFWNDAPFLSPAGIRYLQTEFIWQLAEVASYLKSQLTPEEFDYIVGIDPINEPIDGGTEGLTYDQWDNQKLWPFYQRVRAAMSSTGWEDKLVFAEPNVFWSSIAGPVAPATGGHYLDYKPGDGFVFNSHFYDQARMGVNDLSVARNGAYFNNIDLIRDEARFLDIPVFVSEFGMWLGADGHQDGARISNATYQALEISDQSKAKDRHANLYQPVVSGTQWHWGYYYDNHHEYKNGNTNILLTEDDAWNDENFSVIKDYATGYNVPHELVERAYLRSAQGHIMNMYYNAMVPDAWGNVMSWGAMRVSVPGKYTGKPMLEGKKFFFATWRGRHSDAPTEIFVPRHINADNLVIITERRLYNATLDADAGFNQSANEVAIVSDTAGGGNRIIVWDDADMGEHAETLHWVLIIENNNGLSAVDVSDLQVGINYTLNSEHKNPVYLTNDMTHGGYAAEADPFWYQLKTAGKCMDVAGGIPWNGTNVQLYDCNGTNAQKWYYEESTGHLRSKTNWNKCLDNRNQAYNGGGIVIWDCQNNNNLKFDWVGTSLRNRHNNNYAVDAYGTSSGSNIGQWQYHGGANQQWIKAY